MDKSKRQTVIAGNWKMNTLPSEVPAYMAALTDGLSIAPGETAALCVPFPHIPAVKAAAAGTGIKTGAQDVSVHDSGAYTGEVSAAMLADLGADFCVVGHSERRAYHHETDGEVNEKLAALLRAGIRPIVCVGESLAQRDGGETLSFVAGQVKAALRGVTAEALPSVVVAYEPIWAIGTGRTATAAQAQEVCAHIRGVIGALYSSEAAGRVSILYGGSMNGKNAAELLAQPDIDGGLIGGASLKPAEFASIIKAGGENG